MLEISLSNVGLEDDIHQFTEFLTQQHHKHKVTVAKVTVAKYNTT